MIKILKLTFLLISFLGVSFILASNSKAQVKPGITVMPSIIHIDLEQDPSEYILTYTNTTKTEINLLLSSQDFSELEDAYRVNFLDAKDAQNYKYSLSSWITFENKNIQFAPGEKKSVKIFIDKDRITRGGHYASILAEIIQPEENKQVNVKAVLSSLVFVRASTGLEIEAAKVATFLPIRDYLEYPESIMLRFENTGNVHVVPYGLVEITDPLGNLASTGILNEGSLDALPESIRRYDVILKNNNKVLLPGFYTAKISIHFGKQDKKISSSVKFFSQGSFDFIKLSFAALIILVIGIYLRRKLKNRG